jgi:hypothetical protein
MGLMAALFTEPIMLTGWLRLVMLLPLCLSIAVVYKAVKIRDLGRLPAASVALWSVMVFGLIAVGVALLVIYRLLM